MKNKKKENGDCFRSAANYLMDVKCPENYVLCHGVVSGQGHLEGKKILHAWCETADGNIVIDKSNGNNFENLRLLYYAIGRIDENDVIKYTKDEMLKNLITTENWGAWDSDLNKKWEKGLVL